MFSIDLIQAVAPAATNVDEVIKFIQTVGFPIAVAAYVLIRMETTQRDLIKAVNSLASLLERVLNKETRV